MLRALVGARSSLGHSRGWQGESLWKLPEKSILSLEIALAVVMLCWSVVGFFIGHVLASLIALLLAAGYAWLPVADWWYRRQTAPKPSEAPSGDAPAANVTE